MSRIAPLLSLISQSEIPWLTAVPDGIITPRFHSQLARDPPPAEVAVPLLCPWVNINTNIWHGYVMLSLLGDALQWAAVITLQVLILSFHLCGTSVWQKQARRTVFLSVALVQYCAEREKHRRRLSWKRTWENLDVLSSLSRKTAWRNTQKAENRLSFKVQSPSGEHGKWYCTLLRVHLGLCQCLCSCTLSVVLFQTELADLASHRDIDGLTMEWTQQTWCFSP